MSAKIQEANKKYYSSKGKKIYSDFSTFAQGKALARCNALEFVRDFSGTKGGNAVVCEYGIGKGDFAKTFLDVVKKLDGKLYARTRYYLYDFSDKMIADARKSLVRHGAVCVFGKFDAASESPFLQFDYCRINELLTDLPTLVCELRNNEVRELGGNPIGNTSPFVSEFLKRVEEGRAMPFNFAGAEFLAKLCACGKRNFRVDVFDYGFYSSDEVFEQPVDEWNSLMVRDYGGQLTTDLNVPFVLAYLSSNGIAAKVEKQKEYCEHVLGKKLVMSELKSGLDYVPAMKNFRRNFSEVGCAHSTAKKSDDIEEDDGFYHLRMGR